MTWTTTDDAAIIRIQICLEFRRTEFEAAYRKVQEERGNIDLSAVWIIEPVEIIDKSFEKRRLEEEEAHPILKHVDRLLV